MKAIGLIRNRPVYRVEGLPPFGYIGFGVIDRGTNVVQARPTTICPQNCVFCSVDAGPYSKHRWAEFVISEDIILKGVSEAARVKNTGIEVLIDTVGDALTYPQLPRLIRELKSIPGVFSVALETHGALLTKKYIDVLQEAGLDRVNLSLDTLNPEKAKFLYGIEWYNVRRVVEAAEYLVKETAIDLHVTPVWLPGLNDKDVEEVVKWAYSIGAGKKWPPATIQKFVKHKHGRAPPGVREIPWDEFWKWIEEFEKRTGLRVKWEMREWGMRYAPSIDLGVRKGDLLEVSIESLGLFKGEYLGVSPERGLVSAVFPGRFRRLRIGYKYIVRVTDAWDTIVVAEALDFVE